jgi:hypothetical protein
VVVVRVSILYIWVCLIQIGVTHLQNLATAIVLLMFCISDVVRGDRVCLARKGFYTRVFHKGCWFVFLSVLAAVH